MVRSIDDDDDDDDDDAANHWINDEETKTNDDRIHGYVMMHSMVEYACHTEHHYIFLIPPMHMT